jgi:CRISPR/Cas system CSM-associated protein Csm3 (group 7 of RAMP superfamily)
MRGKIAIKFLSDWIVSSGLGDGSRADQVLVRDENGLLFLPGRSVKGILREASRELEAAASGTQDGMTDKVFGGNKSGATRNPGIIRVGRGELEDDPRKVLNVLTEADRRLFVTDLTVVRSQTAISEDTGTAKDKSLRRIECGVPGITFISNVEIEEKDVDSMDYASYLGKVCRMVRVMGAGRYRGLGRCEFEFLSENAVSKKEDAA